MSSAQPLPSPETRKIQPVETEVLFPRPELDRPVGHTALEGFTILDTIKNDHSPLRAALSQRIIGQPDAIDAIVDALDRKIVRAKDDHRPVTTLAFLGPTGVGKTETAKTVGEINGSDTDKLLTIDCSNFSHGHEIASLIGSPVGYVGHGEKPFFTKEKVEKPGIVVLFDEIEKGSDELYNLMLQIMDEGRLVLNNGTTVSFRNAMIILTSNLGAKQMAAQLSKTPLGFGGNGAPRDTSKSTLEKVALREVKKFFNPEFINRIHRMVVFQPLDQISLEKILTIKMNAANENYREEHGAEISLSAATTRHLIEIAQREPELGARPLVRAMEDSIETILGRHIKNGNIPDGSQIRVFHSTELPREASTGEQALVFAVRPDESLRRPKQVLAITQGESEAKNDD